MNVRPRQYCSWCLEPNTKISETVVVFICPDSFSNNIKSEEDRETWMCRHCNKLNTLHKKYYSKRYYNRD